MALCHLVRAGAQLGVLALLPGICCAQLKPAAQHEINMLLRAVGESGCTILRSGTVHTAAEAQRHLNMKYEHLAARSLLASSEDFIDKAATRSSMTGEAYTIRCGELAPVPTDAWLRARLRLIRQAPVTR
jgi:hypothetical protein